MSHPNSPVAKETLKDHVGSSTVPSNATLQIRVSKPWSLRKFSPKRRSPQKRHNRYKIILPRPDTQLALRPNSPLRKGGFSLDPPVACPPHPHPDCNRGLLIRVYLPYLNWAVLVYFGLCILSIFVQDIKQRIATQSLENTVDSISCGNQYKSNKCGTDQRAPMLDRECQTWEICMKADPYVDQSKIFVLYVSELLGDFFEGFLGRLSPKAFISLCAMLIIIIGNLQRARR